MDALEQCKNTGQCKYKEYKSLKDLELNKKFKIEKFERIKDKYGWTIIVELEKFKSHLPNRFVTVMDDKIIKEMNRKNLSLIITEIKTFKDKETVLIDFEEN